MTLEILEFELQMNKIQNQASETEKKVRKIVGKFVKNVLKEKSGNDEQQIKRADAITEALRRITLSIEKLKKEIERDTEIARMPTDVFASDYGGH